MTLKELQEQLRQEVGEDFAQASEHNYNCRCSICLEWWVQMGPEPISEDEWKAGPFTREEFEKAGGVWPKETITSWLWAKHNVDYHNFVLSYQHLDEEPESAEEDKLAEAWLRKNRPEIWKEWETLCQSPQSS